jgi:hypothetical protein
MFAVGDIVVSNKYCAGMGCEKSFAKITKITKTGRFRAQPLEKKIISSSGGGADTNYCMSSQVLPVVMTDSDKTILMQSNGTYGGHEYEKYDSNKEYYDVCDSYR